MKGKPFEVGNIKLTAEEMEGTRLLSYAFISTMKKLSMKNQKKIVVFP